MLVGGRQARQAKSEALQVEKDRLILQMGSPFNESAVEAARQLRWRGWLEDGSVQEARLRSANLQGAVLLGANLRGVNLERDYLGDAKFNEETLLPDNTKWTPNTDMAKFTDPDHDDFWREDRPSSPAYRGADNPDDPGYEEHKKWWPDD